MWLQRRYGGRGKTIETRRLFNTRSAKSCLQMKIAQHYFIMTLRCEKVCRFYFETDGFGKTILLMVPPEHWRVSRPLCCRGRTTASRAGTDRRDRRLTDNRSWHQNFSNKPIKVDKRRELMRTNLQSAIRPSHWR